MQHRRYDRRRCGAANPGLAPEAVPKRTSHRERSRKRRASSAAVTSKSSAGSATASAPAGRPRAADERTRPRAQGAGGRGAGGVDARPNGRLSPGERPQAPWHPLPLSEILIFAGAIAVVVGFLGGENGVPALLAGIGAVALGTIEVTYREHMSGYRSHAIILALLPTLLLHSVVILLVSFVTPVPRALNIALLVIDVAVFAVLYKLLRARYLTARHRRTVAAAR